MHLSKNLAVDQYSNLWPVNQVEPLFDSGNLSCSNSISHRGINLELNQNLVIGTNCDER